LHWKLLIACCVTQNAAAAAATAAVIVPNVISQLTASVSAVFS